MTPVSDASGTARPVPARVRPWLWFVEILALYTVIAATFATEEYVMELGGANADPWWRHFLRDVPTWYSWALATPLILAIARRSRFEVGQRRRTVLIHLLGMVPVAALQVGLDYGLTLALKVVFDASRRSLPQLLDLAPKFLLANALDVPQMYATIAAIYYTFDYYRKFRARELRTSQLETQLAQARLQVLRTQLQPHFLFNTLNAIATLMHRDVTAAERMVTLLGDLLRTSLDHDGAQEVALKQELELLERYLEIEEIRFSDRLGVTFDVDPAALDAAVPNLILQPLVENAIKHGIAPRSSPGHVRVCARRREGSIEIEVADDGVGLAGRHHGEVREGVGLSNTRARLAQLYGEAARCDLGDASGGGFAVRLTIPFRPATPRAERAARLVGESE